jgi:hypothetical protein
MNGLEDLSEVFRVAAIVLAAGPGETLEARLALAWVARNRGQVAISVGGVLEDACRSLTGHAGGREEGTDAETACCDGEGDCLRALALACQVLAGDLPDPTDGAVLYHRHDEQPDWAAGRLPTALIGSHFFYRLDEKGICAEPVPDRR